MALSQAGVTLPVNYASKQMLSECWLVKLIRETFTQKPRKRLVKGIIQPGSNVAGPCDIYKWDRGTGSVQSHRGKGHFAPLGIRSSATLDNKKTIRMKVHWFRSLQRGGSGSCPGLAKGKQCFPSVSKYELLNVNTNPRHGKALHCSVFILKITNVSIYSRFMFFRYLTVKNYCY